MSTVIRTDRHTSEITRHEFTPELCKSLAKYVCGVSSAIRHALANGETVVTNYATWKLETP